MVYCKKFSILCNGKTDLNNMTEVYAHYMGLLHKDYLYLKTLHYSKNECAQYFDPIFECIKQMQNILMDYN